MFIREEVLMIHEKEMHIRILPLIICVLSDQPNFLRSISLIVCMLFSKTLMQNLSEKFYRPASSIQYMCVGNSFVDQNRFEEFSFFIVLIENVYFDAKDDFVLFEFFLCLISLTSKSVFIALLSKIRVRIQRQGLVLNPQTSLT